MTNNTINEIKNSPEGINSRITEAEEWISDLEDKMQETFNKDVEELKRNQAMMKNTKIGRASCRERV